MIGKKIIWVINQFALLPGQSGGTRHYSILKHLNNEKYKVKIITGQSGYSATNHQNTLGIFEYSGVEFIVIRDSIIKNRRPGRIESSLTYSINAAIYVIKNSSRREDAIIIGSSPNIINALVANLIAKAMGFKYLLEIRDIWPKSIVQLTGIKENSIIVRILSRIEKYLYNHSDHIISLLEGFKLHRDLTVKSRKEITWIPNGYDFDGNYHNEAIGAADESFKVYYAGSHGLANNLESLLRAAELLKKMGNTNISFHLVGDGTSKRGLLEYANRMKLDNVTFHDSVPKDKLPYILGHADAFIIPAHDSQIYEYGVSPNKLFDYMAAKKPVIFAINTPFNPISKADSGITIRPDCEQDIVEAVIKLSKTSRRERLEIGLRGYDYIKANHSYEKLAKDLEHTLSSL